MKNADRLFGVVEMDRMLMRGSRNALLAAKRAHAWDEALEENETSMIGRQIRYTQGKIAKS
jgi:hypothetical protein